MHVHIVHSSQDLIVCRVCRNTMVAKSSMCFVVSYFFLICECTRFWCEQIILYQNKSCLIKIISENRNTLNNNAFTFAFVVMGWDDLWRGVENFFHNYFPLRNFAKDHFRNTTLWAFRTGNFVIKLICTCCVICNNCRCLVKCVAGNNFVRNFSGASVRLELPWRALRVVKLVFCLILIAIITGERH